MIKLLEEVMGKKFSDNDIGNYFLEMTPKAQIHIWDSIRHKIFCTAWAVCLVTQLCQTLCDPMDCRLTSSSVHGDSPGKNTGVGCHALLLGIFPTQGSNPGLPH